MKTIYLIYFDAGGGHRSAANALGEVIEQQGRPWRIEKVNLQELFDSIDIFRKVTGMRMQDIYNSTLRRGWTLGSPQLMWAMHGIIRLFHSRQLRVREFWSNHPADLVVSLIPNFNRALFESLHLAQPGVPYLTVMTDMADYPPAFWMERQRQYLVCGTNYAVKQAREMNYSEDRILRTSGMILHPRFYETPPVDRDAGRRTLGLRPDLPVGLLLFGAYGSGEMETIVETLSASGAGLQLIVICGHNAALAQRIRELRVSFPIHVEGFTREIPALMQLSDFFIGKPGPASISEALRMKLPVIVERNAWTLPQERYNADWVLENGVGIVLSSFRNIQAAVEKMLNAETYAGFQAHACAHDNRAVFEIPVHMEDLLSRADNAETPNAKSKKNAP